MMDHDLSHQLHSLAASVDGSIDLTVLHRRITVQNRRRVAARAGFAGVGVAAVVGGLFVVTNERSGPSQGGFASAPAAPSQPAPTMEDPPALPDCASVLAALPSTPPAGSEVSKDVPSDPSPGTDELSGPDGEHGFKGIVTITAIDGPQVSFTADEPEVAPFSPGVGTVDDATEWFDGTTRLTTPPALAVGDQLGLATRPDGEGVDHVILADVGPVSYESKPDVAEKPKGEDVGSLPGSSVPVEANEKSRATITSADATTIVATIEDRAGEPATITIDIATATFYAGNTVCAPGVLNVGDELGVAYHIDDAGTLVADAVLLIE